MNLVRSKLTSLILILLLVPATGWATNGYFTHGVSTVENTIIIQNDDELTDLGALSKLTSLNGGLSVNDNALLSNLDGLEGLTSIGSLSVAIPRSPT